MANATKMSDLWDAIYENEDCVIKVHKKRLDAVKRQLSRYKYSKMQEIGELNPGRIKTEILKEVDEVLFLKVWLDFGEQGRDIDLEIVEVNRGE